MEGAGLSLLNHWLCRKGREMRVDRPVGRVWLEGAARLTVILNEDDGEVLMTGRRDQPLEGAEESLRCFDRSPAHTIERAELNVNHQKRRMCGHSIVHCSRLATARACRRSTRRTTWSAVQADATPNRPEMTPRITVVSLTNASRSDSRE